MRSKSSSRYSKNKKGKSSSYIEEIKEWQEHQYEPGYFTGGKIPPFLKYPGKPMLIGLLYLVGGIIFGFLLIYPTIISFNKNDVGEMILAFILFGGVGAIYILVGFRLIKKSKQSKRKKK